MRILLQRTALRKYKTFLKNTDNSFKRDAAGNKTFESLNIPMVKGIEKIRIKRATYPIFQMRLALLSFRIG